MNELIDIARPHLVGGVWLDSEYDGAATGDKYSKYRNVVMNHSIIEYYIYKLNIFTMSKMSTNVFVYMDERSKHLYE